MVGRLQDQFGRGAVAIGIARIAREVLLIVAKGTHGLLLLVDVIVLAAVDLAVLVGGAWHRRGSSRRHSRRGNELLGEDERVRADAKRLKVLATISQDMRSVTVLIGSLPRADAWLLVLHAFLNCSCFPLLVLDDGLVDRYHLLLRWKTSA